MYAEVSALPPADPPDLSVVTEPGKRPWETSKTGYLNWAVGQLMERAKEKARGEQVQSGEDGGGDGAAFAEGSAEVGAAVGAAYGVGRAEDVKAILKAVGGDLGAGGGKEKGKDVERMDMRPG